MLVHLGFFAVLLITNQVKHINDIPTKTKSDKVYRDVSYNEIDVNKYCESKICVLKCCPNGEDLNSEGKCSDSRDVKESDRVINVRTWNHGRDIKLPNRTAFQAFTQNRMLSNFYILEDGFLLIKVINTTGKWLGASPLEFCVNNHIVAAMNKEAKFAFIFKDNRKIDTYGENDIFKFILGGMIVSLLFLGFVVYRMSNVLRRIMSLILLSYICTITASYIIASVQYVSLSANIVNSIECRIISPVLYFFVLSSFFWINVLYFHTWWTLRLFRKYSISVNKNIDSAKYLRLSIYGWLIPFLMTVAAIIVDLLQLDAIFSSVKPPFDSCLGNDNQMLIYMHIPITVLTATSCLFYLLNLYNIFMLQLKYDNILDISKVMISSYRWAVHFRLYIIIFVSGMLELIPNVSSVVYYTIHANNILVGGTIFILFTYERCKYGGPYYSYNLSEKFAKLYRKACGEATVISSASTLGEINSGAVQDNMSSTLTLPNVDNNRY